MTIVKITDADKQVELPVGSRLRQVSSDLDTTMPCHVGSCGSCVFRVMYGEELLNDASQREQRKLPEDGTRLLCQTRIAGEGEIHIARFERLERFRADASVSSEALNLAAAQAPSVSE